jgi:hypothetical protein
MSLASQILAKGGKITSLPARSPIVVPRPPQSAKKRQLEANPESPEDDPQTTEKLLETLRPVIEQEVRRLAEGILNENREMKTELSALREEIEKLKQEAEKSGAGRMDTDVTEEVKRLRLEVDADKLRTEAPASGREDTLRLVCLAEKQEQYSRRESIRIFNVNEHEGENTNSAVVDACLSMGLSVSPQDINISHRVGRRMPHRPRPIICKFVRRDLKHSVMESKHHLGSMPLWSGVGVREDLTAARNRVVQQLRQQKERFRTIDGRIEVTRQGKLIVIDNLFDLTAKLNWPTEKVHNLFSEQRQ